jgi:nucleoside 2-deoxyribosyltransferase
MNYNGFISENTELDVIRQISGDAARLVLERASFICASCWAEDLSELVFILDSYLAHEKGFLNCTIKNANSTLPQAKLQISAKGWDHLESGVPNAESNTAFVAMCFNPKRSDLKEMFESGIERGAEDAGYEAIRVDRTDHLSLVDDEIKALIRKSRFIIADLTEQRGGVYFEAGFAMGLGLQVIWTCEEQEFEKDKLHFDVEHYDFLRWKKGALDVFRKQLQQRIEANFEKGKFKRAPRTA